MKVFQYTCSHSVAGIQAEGITKGVVPAPVAPGIYKMLRGWQWLTDDPDWNRQGWATRETISCDRTEYRFEIVIPKANRRNLYKWDDVANGFGITGRLADKFRQDGGGDSSHWYIYYGRIPRGWIRSLEARPVGVTR